MVWTNPTTRWRRPNAPSFLALNKHTGAILWTDKSPGENILHGQWSSPAAGVLGGVPQVIFAGGDGWVYSFRADAGKDGRPELLWQFDANPKESKWVVGGAGTRNNIIATPSSMTDWFTWRSAKIRRPAMASDTCGASIPPSGAT